MKWTEQSIGAAVYNHVFKRKHLVLLPNTYHTGFETDLLVVRNDLRLMDIEIKISRSDLKADQHKDKWSKQMYHTWGHPRPPALKVEWPAKIWKHYYLLPRDIWTDELLLHISPKSGILFIRSFRDWHGRDDDNTPLISIRRQAKPNRDAKAIPAEDLLDIARGCSARMWESYNKIRELDGSKKPLAVPTETCDDTVT